MKKRISFSQKELKDKFATLNFATRFIRKRKSDFAISREFYFHEASHLRSFAKIKPLRKFPNLQYLALLHQKNIYTFLLLKKQARLIRIYHSHTLQSNLQDHEVEPQNNCNHKTPETPGRQRKKSN